MRIRSRPGRSRPRMPFSSCPLHAGGRRPLGGSRRVSIIRSIPLGFDSVRHKHSWLRRHEDECLPPLDMGRQPPTQELATKDLHGVDWRFRHIFRDHKWFKEAGGIASDPTAMERPIISRMRSFKTMTIFKRSILKMIAETVVLDNECLGLRKVFKSLSTFCKKNEISFDNVKTGLLRWVDKHGSEEMNLLLDAV